MKVLLLNQCFWPDVVSTAQHLTDLAVELTERGHSVRVITGDRGYDNPQERFPRRETWRGIDIVRISALSFGKQTRFRRGLNFSSFLVNCALHLLFLPRFDAVIALTSPPLISFLGSVFTQLKGGKFYFWVMDLNPDEAIAAGWLNESSLAARALRRFLRYSLRNANRIIVLDRFMKERILEKGILEENIVTLPPWSHDDTVRYDEEGRKKFRRRHNLSGKYVVMYSGNHSPCHPLDTLLRAAVKLADDPHVRFCFVGGGSEHDKVGAYAKEHQLENIVCLPYQPLDKLSVSLSAADLHVVVMGNSFPGIVHPCKIYNILEIGSPVLYIGPTESHIEDLVSQFEDKSQACRARHGDVDLVVGHISASAQKLTNRRSPSARALSSRFSKRVLLPQILGIIEGIPIEKQPEPALSKARTASASR